MPFFHFAGKKFKIQPRPTKKNLFEHLMRMEVIEMKSRKKWKGKFNFL